MTAALIYVLQILGEHLLRFTNVLRILAEDDGSCGGVGKRWPQWVDADTCSWCTMVTSWSSCSKQPSPCWLRRFAIELGLLIPLPRRPTGIA